MTCEEKKYTEKSQICREILGLKCLKNNLYNVYSDQVPGAQEGGPGEDGQAGQEDVECSIAAMYGRGV